MFFSFTGKTGLASERNYCRHNPPGQFVSVPFVVLVAVVLVGFMHGWFALLSPKNAYSDDASSASLFKPFAS